MEGNVGKVVSCSGVHNACMSAETRSAYKHSNTFSTTLLYHAKT